jgi:hypothetical protein
MIDSLEIPDDHSFQLHENSFFLQFLDWESTGQKSSALYPIPKPPLQAFQRLQLALPQNNHFPSQFPQPILVFAVPFHRSSKFGEPKLRPGGGGVGSRASRMAVPKAAMHENHGGIFGQDDIGAARQIFSVQPEPESHSMKQRANLDFRLGVPGPHPPHNFASFFGGNGIHENISIGGDF